MLSLEIRGQTGEYPVFETLNWVFTGLTPNSSWRTTVPDFTRGKFREIVKKLRNSVGGIQAVILVGSEGVRDCVLEDSTLNIDLIAGEYETLLRIAHRASEDSGAGNLLENIMVSEKSTMIARSIAPQDYVILLFRSHDQIGRARYELKRAASEIEPER
jgi:predicted regulator of Ras-like GTPase activity (Roadblock/LC7/MglB family)